MVVSFLTHKKYYIIKV